MKKQYRIVSCKNSYGEIVYWVERFQRTDNLIFGRYKWASQCSERSDIAEAEMYLERLLMREREEAVLKMESMHYGVKVHKLYDGIGNINE